jgi:hypothetical protein
MDISLKSSTKKNTFKWVTAIIINKTNFKTFFPIFKSNFNINLRMQNLNRMPNSHYEHG